MKDIGRMHRQMQELIATAEPCPEKDRMQARFDMMIARLRDYPRRFADQAPFADRAEAEAVLTREMEYVLAAMERLD
jgi:hypothetical protein